MAEKYIPNYINITVKEGKKELLNQDCCTVLSIFLNNEGGVQASFFGSYDKNDVKILQKAQRVYLNKIIKKLDLKTKKGSKQVKGKVSPKDVAIKSKQVKDTSIKKPIEKNKKH